MTPDVNSKHLMRLLAVAVACLGSICVACQSTTTADCSTAVDDQQLQQLMLKWTTLNPNELVKWWRGGTHPRIHHTRELSGEPLTNVGYGEAQQDDCLCCDLFFFRSSHEHLSLRSVVITRSYAEARTAIDIADRLWRPIAKEGDVRRHVNMAGLQIPEGVFRLTSEARQSTAAMRMPLDLSIANNAGSYIVSLHIAVFPDVSHGTSAPVDTQRGDDDSTEVQRR
jgi:hypothetical protein